MSPLLGMGIQMYTEVSSFQGVGTEGCHYIHKGVLTSGKGSLLYTEVSFLGG